MEKEEYLKKVQNNISTWIQDLGDRYIFNLFNSIESGKMVRSQLMFYIGQNRNDEVVPLSAIIELIHLASLLHDDVIDDADMRRGKPSINVVEGSKVSIMLGDIFYSKAFAELAKYPKEIIEQIANSVVRLSIGELQDVNLSKKFNNDENLYFEMIYNKTASLIETATKVSAILVGKDGAKFGEYGKNLGIAFQIIDDILDITQTAEQLGKPNLNDFVEGKTTLPYIYLYNLLDSPDREKLVSLHGKTLEENDRNWLLSKFQSSGAIEKSYQVAKYYSEKAIYSLPEENSKLVEVVYKLVDRTK